MMADFRNVVYNAARDGKLQRLRIYLDHRSPAERYRLVHAKTSQGATPLIMACRNGHFDVVEYLISVCKVDIGQVGCVVFDGETIEGAPPLWCAAAAGHLSIVQFLVQNGAEVNNTTYTNSTSLRAACFDGHYEVVEYLIQSNADIEIANRHGHTCLMISCYKGHYQIVEYLLQLNAQVNRKSVKGNTALHDCAESGSLEIMELLLKHGAQMEKDSYGVTPLLAASVSGHTNIVEYLISLPECESERVNALELVGATYVDKKRDMLGALQYWRRALNLRLSKTESLQNTISKTFTVSKPSLAAYENVHEFQNHAELFDAVSDPDNMRMQALLIRERILGPSHPDTSYYIRYRGAVYADMGNFERCIQLWMYALEMQQANLEPMNPMTHSSFVSFAELFTFIMDDSRVHPNDSVSFSDMTIVLSKAIEEVLNGRQALQKLHAAEKEFSYFHRHLIIIMHCISLLCRNQVRRTAGLMTEFKKQVYKVVRLNPKGNNGVSLLHLACSGETSTLGRDSLSPFPNCDVISLLLEMGADVNAADLDNNTPLHVAAANKPCQLDVVKLLLDNKAHLDACNFDHKTPMQLIRNATIYDIASPLMYVNLQCLAATVLVKYGIPFEGLVPKRLESFIRMH